MGQSGPLGIRLKIQFGSKVKEKFKDELEDQLALFVIYFANVSNTYVFLISANMLALNECRSNTFHFLSSDEEL